MNTATASVSTRTTAPRATDDKIRRARAGTVKRWNAGKGLYLEANWTPGGLHSWRFDFPNPTKGKRDSMSLGQYPAVSIVEAEAEAAKARAIIARGQCPKAVRKAEAEALARDIADREEAAARIAAGKAARNTVRDIADRFLASRWVKGGKKNQWSDHYGSRWVRMMDKHVHPFIGDMQCADVTPADIYGVIERMDAAGIHEASKVVRIHLTQTFSLAQVVGLCKEDPVAPVGVVVRRAKHTKGHPAIVKPGELVELFKALNTSPNPTLRAALLVSLYVAQRPVNVQAMKWAHIDWDAAQWVIPAAEMKGTKAKKISGDDHIVPLCRQAVAVLREVLEYVEKDAAGEPVSPFVFGNQEWKSGQGLPLSADRVRDELDRLGFKGRQSLHGFRATFRSMCREFCGIGRDCLEFQLAHGTDEPLGPAYARETLLAERTEAVQVWADYIDRLTASGAVVEMARRAA